MDDDSDGKSLRDDSQVKIAGELSGECECRTQQDGNAQNGIGPGR